MCRWLAVLSSGVLYTLLCITDLCVWFGSQFPVNELNILNVAISEATKITPDDTKNKTLPFHLNHFYL